MVLEAGPMLAPWWLQDALPRSIREGGQALYLTGWLRGGEICWPTGATIAEFSKWPWHGVMGAT